MDLVIVRENTEGFYADRSMYMGPGEFMPDPDSAFSIRKITAPAVRRVARSACAIAMTRRKRLTAVPQATVLKLTDGLFPPAMRAGAAGYPELTTDEVNVDTRPGLPRRDPRPLHGMCPPPQLPKTGDTPS